jgi:hypothetical protein
MQNVWPINLLLYKKWPDNNLTTYVFNSYRNTYAGTFSCVKASSTKILPQCSQTMIFLR